MLNRSIVYCFLSSILFYSTPSFSDEEQQPNMQLLWETDALLKTPESVRYDSERQVLFVSNIIGNPWGDDGIASIARVSLDGSTVDTHWVSGPESGLSAPKGLAIYEDKLYVADLYRIVIIDIDGADTVGTIEVDGAKGLHDISIDDEGVIYVSDSFTGNLTRIADGEQSHILEGENGLNGVFADDEEVYYVANGGLFSLSLDDSFSELIADGMEGYVDGLERIDEDNWLVTCWLGVSYIVNENGAIKALDTRDQFLNSADLGYDPESQTAYVPTFWSNTIQAFKVIVADD